MDGMTSVDREAYGAYWEQAYEWTRYLEDEVEVHRRLWEGVYQKSEAPEWAVAGTSRLPGNWKLLVLSEDWCGDASNTVPVLARFAEAAPNVSIRILKRDEVPELMDSYLTNGARSIPLVILLDCEDRPVGRWGPRPRDLQEFVLGEKRRGDRSNEEIYKDTRNWYARDRGESTLRELLQVMEYAASTTHPC
jgi:hypothetical protein